MISSGIQERQYENKYPSMEKSDNHSYSHFHYWGPLLCALSCCGTVWYVDVLDITRKSYFAICIL